MKARQITIEVYGCHTVYGIKICIFTSIYHYLYTYTIDIDDVKNKMSSVIKISNNFQLCISVAELSSVGQNPKPTKP